MSQRQPETPIHHEVGIPTTDLALKLGYTKRYTSSLINGGVYYEDAVCRISKELSVPVPSGEGATLARKNM